MSVQHETRIGAIYASIAFITWGIFPLFFKLLQTVPAIEILCHRALWAALWMAVWLQYKNSWHRIKEALISPFVTAALFASALLIAVNWGIFIWAVNTGKVLETSLGYFINPLINVLLGWVFLNERLYPSQKLAVALAVLGTFNLVLQHGDFPWVACCLAISFGFYGLLRKTIPVEALPGLFIETLFLSPLAMGYVIYLTLGTQSHFILNDAYTSSLLICSGLITLLPLLWFGNAARRLRLITLGFFQYLSPSISFLLAVFLFKETFTITHFITFLCIWSGLAIFSYDSIRKSRSYKMDAALETTDAKN